VSVKKYFEEYIYAVDNFCNPSDSMAAGCCNGLHTGRLHPHFTGYRCSGAYNQVNTGTESIINQRIINKQEREYYE